MYKNVLSLLTLLKLCFHCKHYVAWNQGRGSVICRQDVRAWEAGTLPSLSTLIVGECHMEGRAAPPLPVSCPAGIGPWHSGEVLVACRLRENPWLTSESFWVARTSCVVLREALSLQLSSSWVTRPSVSKGSHEKVFEPLGSFVPTYTHLTV